MSERTPEYVIEIRDINGVRTTTAFDTRGQFYKWVHDVQDGDYGDPEELQIMLITQNVQIHGASSSVVLYSALGHDTNLDWEDLVGYLA